LVIAGSSFEKFAGRKRVIIRYRVDMPAKAATSTAEAQRSAEKPIKRELKVSA
jgi:hypothetical protein